MSSNRESREPASAYKAEFKPGLRATAVGSMPQADPQAAWEMVNNALPAIPVWPQLPNRSFRENMYVQYSEGFPGVVVQGEDRIYVDRGRSLDEGLERLYLAYLQNDLDSYAITPQCAAGLHQMLSADLREAVAVKGQVTGPISWGLSVTDQSRRPILYDEVLADALAKHLRLKAAWEERSLSALNPQTIIFVDEPYLSALGSAFVSVSRGQVIGLLEEVLAGIQGLKGVHCCGNTDWSVLLDTSIDILNFDAYNYAESLSLYPDQVRAFLDRGGIIAWGIVPNEEKGIEAETAESLASRLEEAMGLLVRKGISRDLLSKRCLITPSCGLGGLSPALAGRALQLAASLSSTLRARFGGDEA